MVQGKGKSSFSNYAMCNTDWSPDMPGSHPKSFPPVDLTTGFLSDLLLTEFQNSYLNSKITIPGPNNCQEQLL